MKLNKLFLSLSLLALLSSCGPSAESSSSSNSDTSESTTSESTSSEESSDASTSNPSSSESSEEPASASSNSSTSEESSSSESSGESSSTESSSEESSSSSSSEEVIVEKTKLQRDYQNYSENPFWYTSAVPIHGTPNVIVIPVWFTDSSTYITNDAHKANVLEDIETCFNGTEEETGWQSVKTYYETLSNGDLSLNFTVTSWYEASGSTRTYGMASDIGSLVTSATNWYFNTYDTSANRKDYDYNGDGYIDGVMLIYGSPNYYSLNNENYSNLWAYCYWLQQNDANVNNPVPNAYFWSSYDFMYDSSTALERTGTSYNYGDNDNTTVDSHTFIHEMGHVLGYDNDYYDYSGTCAPAGGFSMQDYNVGSHDPYSIMASGWADPYIPTESCTIEIGAFQSTHDLILLTLEWNSVSSPFDEYLLLELYTPTGLNQLDAENQYQDYPKGPTATGIRLWHVDARLTTSTNGGYTFTTNLFVDPLDADQGCMIAMTNTYSGSYITSLGSRYASYNQLQLIRNDKTLYHNRSSFVTNSDLFGAGSSFSMDYYPSVRNQDFSKQFVNNSSAEGLVLLNSNKELGWSFEVTSISGEGDNAKATITLTRG